MWCGKKSHSTCFYQIMHFNVLQSCAFAKNVTAFGGMANRNNVHVAANALWQTVLWRAKLFSKDENWRVHLKRGICDRP